MSGNSSSVVAIGQAVTVQIQFAPQATGAASGSLSVMSNAPNAPLTVSLAGVATQAALSISPASLSFNNIVVGQTSTQSVTLTNNGNASLTLTAAKLTGAGFGTTGLSLPVTLNAGQGTSFNVQFAPTTTNASSGSIAFTDNATGSPQTLTMSGSAVNPSSTLSANPGTINFSNVVVGNTGTQTVSLNNTGGAAVTITQVSPAGTGFGVTGVTVGQTIAAGSSISFAATFTPTAAGVASGSVTINSNASDSTVSVALAGTGTQGSLAANPSSVNFGSVLVGSNGSVSVTISNPGTAALSITGATIAGAGFSMTSLPPQSLNPGQATSFTATLTPTSAGSPTGTVSIVSNAPGSPLKINLSGSVPAAQAQISISPSALAFNTVAVGSSATQNFTLTNTGNAALNITAAGITGSGYTTNLSAPATIAPGANSTFTVTYAPTSEGSASGSVSLTSNAPGSPEAITLSGTGLQAQPAANPTSTTFANVAVGNSNSQPITLKNNGNTTLTFSQVSVTGSSSGFSVTGISTTTTIAAGASTTFNAVFTPTLAGTVSGSVVLTTNGAPSQLTVALSGTGAASTQQLGASPATLSFGSVPAGQSASLTTTLTNTGNSNVNITGVTASGTGFSASGIGSGLVLTPGQTATLTVQFAPTTTGTDAGSVSVASNATNSVAISLSGSSHAVTLFWNASTTSGVTGYNVYRGTSPGAYGTTPLNASLLPATTYVDPSVSAGQTYYYVVQAVDPGGASPDSSSIQAAIPTP